MCDVPPAHEETVPCPVGEGLCANRLAIDYWRVFTGYWPDVSTGPFSSRIVVREGATLPMGYEVTWTTRVAPPTGSE